MAQKKRSKESAIDSSGIINQVLILCLNPIAKSEEWSKPETYNLRAEKGEESTES